MSNSRTAPAATASPGKRGAPISIQDISKDYGPTRVVHDVNLDIRAGEFVSLLGASGSGKTTLLRMLAGFISPTGGSISIDGRDVTQVQAHKRDIGMVFQNYALFPHLTVKGNVSFPLEMRRVPRIQRTALVTEALERVQLQGLGERKVSQLSGGQQQRVAFARATVFHPRLLLMDEPLGALDRGLRDSMQIEIMRLSRALGLTVVYVTHDQDEAFTMSDRIALLQEGRIVQCDAPVTMYEQPESEAVARFLGESNVFRGTVRVEGSRSLFSSSELAADVTGSVEGGNVKDAGGGDVALVVRPARMRMLHPNEPAQSGAFSGGYLRGRVSAVIYAGSQVKFLVTTGSGRELIVRSDASLRREFQTDDEVVVGWRQPDALLTRTSLSPEARQASPTQS